MCITKLTHTCQLTLAYTLHEKARITQRNTYNSEQSGSTKYISEEVVFGCTQCVEKDPSFLGELSMQILSMQNHIKNLHHLDAKTS